MYSGMQFSLSFGMGREQVKNVYVWLVLFGFV